MIMKVTLIQTNLRNVLVKHLFVHIIHKVVRN